MKQRFCTAFVVLLLSACGLYAASGNAYQFTEDIRNTMMDAWTNKYYTPTQYGHKISGGFWSEAENMEVLLDAYQATGNQKYHTMFDEVYRHFLATQWEWNYQRGNWMPNDFNDDIMWISIACIRAYMLFGTQEYYERAVYHFNETYNRALTDQGLMVWRQWYNGITPSTSGSNSCICGPTEVCACYLGLVTGDESYFTKARNLYAAQRDYLYNPETGEVFDSFSRDQNDLNNRSKFSYNYWVSTYNQGTFLGAACMLFNHYGDSLYYHDAVKIMDCCINRLSNQDGCVNVCGTNGSDLDGFKGILMRYARRFIIDLKRPDYLWWMQKNCMGAYNHRRLSEGIIWTAWWAQTEDGVDYSAFGAGTAASLAVNTYVDNDRIIKNGFGRLEAEHFDYLNRVGTEYSGYEGSRVLSGIQNGYYTVYNNVDFGTNRADRITVRYASIDAQGRIEVRLNTPDGELLGTVNLNNTGAWENYQTLTAELNTPVSGMRNICLVYKTDASYVCNLNWLQFSASSYLYNDITDNGGTLTSSHAASYANEGLDKLTDNSADSKYYSYVGNNPGTMWFQYESPRPVRPLGYGVCSANDYPQRDPSDWTFQASNDGVNWTVLDTQTGVAFARKELKSIGLNVDEPYRYFRLAVTARYGAGADFQVADWQIYGTEQWSENILSDGGVLQYEFAGNGNNEGVAKLTDRKADKYLVPDLQRFWVSYEAQKAYYPVCYTLTAANDAEGRDPMSWVLYGSSDGQHWTALDSRYGQRFYDRFATQAYSITANATYKYYKLDVLSNNGDVMTQLAEWQLFGTRGEFPTDLTDDGGNLTASNYGGGGEGTANIIDNKIGSKNYVYIGAAFHPVWYCYESAYPARLVSYTVASANDTPARDPRSWLLQGSNDGSNWTTLDQQENVVFSARFQEKSFTVNTSSYYSWFRLYITARNNDSDNGFQMSEWQLFGVEDLTPVAAPLADAVRVQAWPNPAVDQVRVSGVAPSAPWQLVTLSGRLVRSGELQDGTLSLQSLPSGVYLLEVEGHTLRVIKR